MDTCHDLYRAYISSTYFYFYEPVDDLDEGEDGDDEERDDEDGDDIEDDVEDLKVVQKPKGSSIPDQPECKNQWFWMNYDNYRCCSLMCLVI